MSHSVTLSNFMLIRPFFLYPNILFAILLKIQTFYELRSQRKPLPPTSTLMTELAASSVTISFGCILYCGCFNLFCNAWACVCVGVLVTCVFVVYYLYCVFHIISFMYIYFYLFSLLHRACCRVTQLLHQPLHIYKIYKIYKLKY